MNLRQILIPASIFAIFASIYLIYAGLFPPERQIYCPNAECHSLNMEIYSSPELPGDRLPDKNWHFYKCENCQAISAADSKVQNLLLEPVWDIKHYQSIALGGYEKYDCDSAIHWPRGDICGNVGWFPAWPEAVKILSLGNISVGLKFLPFLFSLLGIILFYNVIILLTNENTAIIGAIAIFGTPVSFYFLTGFPYAFLFFLFSSYLYLLYNDKIRGRLLLIPVTAGIMASTYPTSALAIFIPLIWLINKYRSAVIKPAIGKIAGDLLYYLLPFVIGPILLSIFFYFTFDDLYLFLHFQEKYDRNWGFPLTVIWKSLIQSPTWETGLFLPPRLNYEKIALIYYGLIFFIFPPYKIKPELVVYSLAVFLFSPMTGNLVSIYRHYLILFPLAMIIAASPRPIWLKILYIAIGIFISIFWVYPFFLNGYLI